MTNEVEKELKQISINSEEMLSEVDKAICSVLLGGQSYKIGSRSVTRADLNMLYKIKNDLMAQIASSNADTLFNDTSVSVFDGR